MFNHYNWIEIAINNASGCKCPQCTKLRKIKEEFLMDKAYKKLGKEAKKIEKDTVEVLKKDKVRDKLVSKGKKAMKKGC